ncbi:MAG: hypothetical protein A2653_00830 [Candidatus Zambryskibacteria bacterium RIFCSPHIGHO2_01_FULL_43_25]|uniref:Signal peptidase I n=1 Tax=Candidatus Zambryskibacteria bacterium RIFCSPLOWO2_01_FULL_45_21 TaxID=1802761 RepID=A0A1G2U4T0_9BACT|nr:MAG: hypothetical protein A2653_00830 [Candidatus Zambryskibacteria bacterium RIFCSPHIGHO2_01_FULL_43_25]OHB00682.1 MAG: hypothetical protein A3E94_03310 [Candidatus Zambryskibacteria bacterium RIFCSPHIGHO2_12_FULL_44_12b]OHB04501.1 MAG: hypothetical protein A3B14_03355 [Candidatus Zambryskibacteria bacterium RIFCSPLOWO2_01_FULL_45_21]
MVSAFFAFGFFIALLGLAVVILYIIGLMRIYRKANKPQWAAIIPIYNTFVLLQIIRAPIWWMIIFLLPLLQLFVTLPSIITAVINIIAIIFGIVITYKLAKVFGKGIGFTIGLILLPPIFYMILGFGKSTYQSGNLTPNLNESQNQIAG